jgi:hypothetical protein
MKISVPCTRVRYRYIDGDTIAKKEYYTTEPRYSERKAVKAIREQGIKNPDVTAIEKTEKVYDIPEDVLSGYEVKETAEEAKTETAEEAKN